MTQPWNPESIRDAHHLARHGYSPALIAVAIGIEAARVARLLGVS
jgi:hypothetical protein